MHDNKPGDVIKELARCYAVVLRAGVNNPIHEPEQSLIDRALKLAAAVNKLQEVASVFVHHAEHKNATAEWNWLNNSYNGCVTALAAIEEACRG